MWKGSEGIREGWLRYHVVSEDAVHRGDYVTRAEIGQLAFKRRFLQSSGVDMNRVKENSAEDSHRKGRGRGRGG